MLNHKITVSVVVPAAVAMAVAKSFNNLQEELNRKGVEGKLRVTEDRSVKSEEHVTAWSSDYKEDMFWTILMGSAHPEIFL